MWDLGAKFPNKNSFSFSSTFRLEIDATFKVLVLRDQDELSGPLEHGIITIIPIHNSTDDIIAIEQPYR